MFSVIFEVHPKKERFDDYLSLARHLKPILEGIDGFIDNERFESLRRPGWLLSHSTWRDEKAVVRWRTEGEHHHVQERGRFAVFRDYHLRVGEVTADSHPPAGVPVVEQRFDETATGAAKYVTLTEIVPVAGADLSAQPALRADRLGLALPQPDVVDHDLFSSIYTPGKLALLVSWRSQAAAAAWTPTVPAQAESVRSRIVRVIRDYGMADRREAPQYYAAAQVS